MGFLSSIFGHSDDREDDENEEFEQESEELPPNFPALNKGLLLNITTGKNRPLLSGRLAEYSRNGLMLERSPGQLSFATCDVGAPVYVRGYDRFSKPIDLSGTVTTSTRVLFEVTNLKVITHNEHRDNFRLPLDVPASLYFQEDEHLQTPEICQLVNISSGGACFDSEYIHGEGEVLRLKVQLEEYAPMTFLGEVVRVEEPYKGKFRYGFLFAKLDEKELTGFNRMLFNIQAGNKKVWKRDSEDGSWG